MNYDDQIDAAVAAIEIDKPRITFQLGWNNGLTIQFNNQLKFNSDKANAIDPVVLNIVKYESNLVLDLKKKAYVVKFDRETLNYRLCSITIDNIIKFLRDHGGYTNNRLSKIYKWYKEKIHVHTLQVNLDLSKDISNIAAFIKTNDSEEHFKTVRTLLSLIKDRYEPRLGSIK